MNSVINYNLTEDSINERILEPEYGEVMICNSDSKGGIEVIEEFKGHKIVNISGNDRKVFIFEEVNESQNVVIALHPQMQDYQQYNGQQVVSIDEIVTELQGNKIIQIKNGKQHNIVLTNEGLIYAYGKGQFGALGLGGVIFATIPRLIGKLFNKRIINVSCGVYHTLALSRIGDVFAWGRGFQGQLGLLKQVQTISSPTLIPHFFIYDHKNKKMLQKKPIKFITCGSYHSIAIDHQGQLYCWGEARYGQTGNGKKTKEVIPKKVQLKINVIRVQQQDNVRKIRAAAAGFGHTMALTDQGEIFTWGLNIKGQLGLCDLPEKMNNSEKNNLSYISASYKPIPLCYSSSKQILPKFSSITCGFSRSFAIDEKGKAWGWGGGHIGFKDKNQERGPTMLTQGTQNKNFTKIFANENSLVLFAPLLPLFFKPSLAPAKGGTQITFFGNGFINSNNQAVRFTAGEYYEEIDLKFDEKTNTFFCQTPSFQKYKSLKLPCQYKVEVTLDRNKYLSYEKPLLIYPSTLSMQSFEPKFGCALGFSPLKIYMPIDQLTLSFIESIAVGFKNNNEKGPNRYQDWICSQGNYQQQFISCKIPNIPHFDRQNPFYLLDVSLNGQQFTDYPQNFRYYMVSQQNITPKQGQIQGEYEIIIDGKGLFDSRSKQIHLHLSFTFESKQYECQRTVQPKWNKTDKIFTFIMPSLTWIIGDHNCTPEMLNEALKQSINLKLLLSSTQSIEIGTFKFKMPPPPPQPEEDPKDKKNSKKDVKKAGKK